MDVFEALQRWQRMLEVSGKANDNTRRQYRNAVFAFCAHVAAETAWTGCRDPMAITEDDIVAYVSEMSAKGGYRNLCLKSLRSFYGYLATREVIGRDPSIRLLPKNPKYGDAPSLSKEETLAVLEAAEAVDPRARWAIQLQYATGCRVGTLCAIEPRDVSFDPPYVKFREAKNDDPYGVPLSEMGLEAVNELLALIDYMPRKVATRLPTLLGVKYGAYRGWLKAAGEAAGVDVFTHLVRHTTITRMAEDPTIDVRSIMAVANWKDPTLLDRYAKKNDARIRNAVSSDALTLA